MDLFDSESFDELGVPAFSAGAPLAVRMRPSRLEEVVGQAHLLGEGAPLRRLLSPESRDGGLRVKMCVRNRGFSRIDL